MATLKIDIENEQIFPAIKEILHKFNVSFTMINNSDLTKKYLKVYERLKSAPQ